MKQFLEKEKHLLQILDSPQLSNTDRNETEASLDEVRESIEQTGWNSM